AGGWLAAVSGFGGMRDYGGKLSFIPRLVPDLVKLTFNLSWRGSHLRVEVTPEEATYTCVSGDPIGLVHHGKSVVVSAGEPPLTLPIPPAPERLEPNQPIGRRPPRRSAQVELDTPAFGNPQYTGQAIPGH
ncbi:MAG: hypothetical protein J2O47_06675, partial [Acidimicrobiaceae bacterium]|nr:hypothetical protein [Acidimicrobiaceae bacterium]